MRREQIGSSTSGMAEIAAPTWWANRNPGIRYVRCDLPARALGGLVRFAKDAIEDGTLESHTGVQVVQIPGTRDHYDMIEWFRKRGQTVLVEFDDDYTEWHEGYANSLKGTTWTRYDRDSIDRWSPSVEMARACVRDADGVIVSTPYLAERYGPLNDRVFVCRNSVDPADWPALRRKDDGKFRVVFAAAPSRQDGLKVRKAMEWVASMPDGEAIVIGQRVDWEGVISVDWVNSLPLLREFLVKLSPDVGLRPLELNRFSLGKSDLKVLEYSMCGAYSVVTPGGPYVDWTGMTGVARNAGEFLAEIQLCYADREMTRKLADICRDTVLETRTIEREGQAWTSAFRASTAAHSVVR